MDILNSLVCYNSEMGICVFFQLEKKSTFIGSVLISVTVRKSHGTSQILNSCLKEGYFI